MKEINVDSHNVPATARSKNYQTAQATTASSGGGGGATSPSVAPTTGGAADTAKVAQNLAEDSTDWAKILRKDIDERTENSLSIGKDITVDGKAILNDVVANTGTFAGLLKAASATITGALLASTVNATTINATTFIGELQGNAATTTKLKTARTIWGKSFDGSGNVDGNININGTLHATGVASLESELFVKKGTIIGENIYSLDGIPVHGVVMGHTLVNTWRFGEYGGNFDFFRSFDPSLNATLIARINTNNNYLLGNLGIGTTTPQYKLDVNGNARIASDLYADATVGTRNFASRTTGWQVNAQGAADFRNIYADELRVQAFTADISQALAGSDYLTKSVSKLSANFVVPSVNSTVRIIVDDIEGMPATRCFVNGDYIRFRAFNRTSGLTIANVWGTVVLDTSYGTNGFLNGTQAYTFTCKATSGAGLTVFKGSEVLDYGTSGSGMISRTTLDAMGSPYEQIATWVNDPSVGSNYTVHARLGNLGGIANCNGYGVYTDNGFFTGNVVIGDLTKNNNFLSFDGVNGLQIKLGGTSVATTTDVNNIQIGGRNLIGGTKDFSGPSHNGVLVDNDYLNFTSVNGNDWTTYKDICKFNLLYLKINQYYTLSFYAKSTVSGDKIRSYFYPNLDGVSDGLTYTILTTEWKRYSITWYRKDLRATNVIVARLMKGDGLGNVSVCGVKFEEGNKATDWTPAPEDVDANIASAKSSAINQSATNAAALYVTQAAYNAEVTILQNSIISKVSQTDFNALGGRVGSAESTITQHSTDIASKVAQTTFDALGTRVSTAESTITQHTTDIGLRVSKDGVIGAINLTSEDATIAASKINLVGAVTIGALDSSVTATALGGATPSDVSTAVNNIQIGGTNIIRYTNQGNIGWNIGASDSAGLGSSTITSVDYNGINACKVEVTHPYDNWFTILQHGLIYQKIVAGKEYTLSFDMLSYNDTNPSVAVCHGDRLNAVTDFNSFSITKNVLKHVTITFTAELNGDSGHLIYINGLNAIGTYIFFNLTLVEGNKAVWSPAPEDVAQDVTNKVNALSAAHGNFTYIDGNSVYTGTLTANQVNAVGINANSITTGTLAAERIAGNTITGDKIAGNTITGDKIVVNSITGDKLIMNTITALGNVTAGSFNIGSGKFVVDANGNMTAINATISGAITASLIGYNASTVDNGLVNGCLIVGGGLYTLPTLADGKCVEYTVFNPIYLDIPAMARISGQGKYDRFISSDATTVSNTSSYVSLAGYHKIVGIGGYTTNGGTLWVYN